MFNENRTSDWTSLPWASVSDGLFFWLFFFSSAMCWFVVMGILPLVVTLWQYQKFWRTPILMVFFHTWRSIFLPQVPSKSDIVVICRDIKKCYSSAIVSFDRRPLNIAKRRSRSHGVFLNNKDCHFFRSLARHGCKKRRESWGKLWKVWKLWKIYIYGR